jgi:hypothetical protein
MVDTQGRQDGHFLPTAGNAFHEDKFPPLLREGVDQLASLWLQAALPHAGQEGCHAPGRIDEIDPSPRPQGIGGCPEEVVQIAQDFMTGQGLLPVGIDPAGGQTPVGRVGHDRVEGIGVDAGLDVTDIPLGDGDPIGQPLPGNGPPGHIHQRVLNLHADKPAAGAETDQEQGKDAAARS